MEMMEDLKNLSSSNKQSEIRTFLVRLALNLPKVSRLF